MRLKDKVCFITGAGSGMGRTAAILFAQQGAKVAAVDLNPEGLEETVRLGAEQGGNILALTCNMTRAAEVAKAVAATVEHFGKLNVLYNNAGIMLAEDRSVVDTEEAVWDKTLAVNVKGIYLACKYAIPEMRRSGGGSIINIASFVALIGCSVPQDAYTASKGAVIALTKSLAVQFGPEGIRSNAICPGPIETPLMTEWLLTDPEAKAVRLARNPSGRFGRTEDIVNLGVYLASDESTWTNGAVMVVDGGITSNYF
ncbi:MAG: glucose 1-dehydrogenase [Desulfitobacteriaceae bacterium]|nr:glucose 1-dehydrogenase [Desulfitobacteriaceae bacterium]MDI6913419.1 glucose 1-dehydrogenase [Desulfitobacteriaceae bacterium]